MQVLLVKVSTWCSSCSEKELNRDVNMMMYVCLLWDVLSAATEANTGIGRLLCLQGAGQVREYTDFQIPAYKCPALHRHAC